MGTTAAPLRGTKITRADLVEFLNQDLAREYQAIIAYVVYSQVWKGAEYMSIAAEPQKHASEELNHALIIAKQIDYLGGMPTVHARTVQTSEKARDMLRFDLLVNEQEHQIDLATALGENVPEIK
jgi:bacterioferritin